MPWRPAQREAIAVVTLLLLSLWPSAQQSLLDQRIWAQAVYRDLTGQISTAPPKPPVLLVQIDTKSIQRSGMVHPQPMDRTYLAQIVDRLAAADPQIIGIDYLFDRQYPNQDPVLAQAVHSAITHQKTWFVFAALENPELGDIGVNPATDIAPPQASLQAHVNALPSHLKLPSPEVDCNHSCPFAYLLALLATYTQETPRHRQLQPSLDLSAELKTQFLETIRTMNTPDSPVGWMSQLRFNPVTEGSSYLGQLWLRPILDFSIPNQEVYDRLPAWFLLEESTPLTRVVEHSPTVVLIVPGGYDGAGISQPDHFPLPPAMRYWRMRLPGQFYSGTDLADQQANFHRFTGAEAHAYMIHHLLTRRLVVPIPDAWLVLLVTIVGKASVLQLGQMSLNHRRRLYLTLGLLGTTGLYGWMGLQLYISGAILLPWLLPTAMVWFYVLPIIWRKGHV